MDITWLGYSCFRIKGKEVTVITDPYPPGLGYSLGRPQADIVTVSHFHPSHSYTQGGPEYLISGGGLTFSKWNLRAQVSRDMENKKTMEEDYFLHYTSQCWGISVTYTIQPGEYRYTAMVDLKGIGSKGAK